MTSRVSGSYSFYYLCHNLSTLTSMGTVRTTWKTYQFNRNIPEWYKTVDSREIKRFNVPPNDIISHF